MPAITEELLAMALGSQTDGAASSAAHARLHRAAVKVLLSIPN
jgi:hypothetical protein